MVSLLSPQVFWQLLRYCLPVLLCHTLDLLVHRPYLSQSLQETLIKFLQFLIDCVPQSICTSPWNDVDMQVVDGLACPLSLLDGDGH